MREVVVDLFAGGGGASEGIRLATGRNPDVAINHDRLAIAMHMANHPGTRHLVKDVWEVPPRWAAKYQPVGLLWASPDCKHFSKAKGKALKRSREIRALAWVVEKWAREVRPRVIILENVEEFQSWGPLDRDGCAIASQKGTTFCAFIRRLRRQGYAVEWRELRASDYGAPTIRKRLFLIARCDGLPIVWPEPTHGPGRIPYRTAAEIIDWSIPCPSIFDRKKPLAENTLRRIAEGIRRYVIEAAEPFIVKFHGEKRPGDFRGSGINEPLATQTTENRFALVNPFIAPITHQGDARVNDIQEPLRTITTAHRGEMALIAPTLMTNTSRHAPSDIKGPIPTVTTGNHHYLVSAFLAKHFGGVIGHEIDRPAGTITTKDHHSLVTSNLVKLRGTCKAGQAVDEPLHTVTSGGTHIGEVRAFLIKYYGIGCGQTLNDPAATVTTKDRFGLVMVKGEPYIITDIGMRMLSPRELYRAQGFSDDYKIDAFGLRITKTDQVRLVGNSVCPPIARALVEANYASEEQAERMRI